MMERRLFGHIFEIDPERVREIRRWVFGSEVEADILVQGVTDAERRTLSLRWPPGWRAVGEWP